MAASNTLLPTASRRGESGAGSEASLGCTLSSYTFSGCTFSGCNLGFFDPSAAPARTGNLFAGKDRTATHQIGGLACVKLTISTFLVLAMFRILFRIRLGGVGNITQGGRLWIFLIEFSLGGDEATTQQRRCGTQVNYKLASIGHFVSFVNGRFVSTSLGRSFRSWRNTQWPSLMREYFSCGPKASTYQAKTQTKTQVFHTSSMIVGKNL
jgi:hypothetical protein